MVLPWLEEIVLSSRKRRFSPFYPLDKKYWGFAVLHWRDAIILAFARRRIFVKGVFQGFFVKVRLSPCAKFGVVIQSYMLMRATILRRKYERYSQ